MENTMSRLVGLTIVLLAAVSGCESLSIQESTPNSNTNSNSNANSNTNSNSDPDITDYTDGNLDPDVTSPNGKVSGEPNDTLDTTIYTVFDSSDSATLVGTIENSSDTDVFSLGSLSAGDRVIVDMNTPDSNLDVCISILDSNEDIFIWNDDEDLEQSLFDSYIDEVIRHDSEYFLIVYAAAYAESEAQQQGTYWASVQVERDGEVPEAVRQILLLDFDGVSSTPSGIPLSSIPAFEAGAISREYEGEDEAMKESIVATMKENYEGFAVDIYTTDDASYPEEPYSTVAFGGYYPGAYGIAEDVDLYNSDLSQMAAIFTESFSPRQFTSFPTAVEMGVAIGNVASHEAGHLLGLHHVVDSTALMDEVSPADSLLEDQDFKLADLSANICPLGVQDAIRLLREIVGLD